jgi:hypothetical protein
MMTSTDTLALAADLSELSDWAPTLNLSAILAAGALIADSLADLMPVAELATLRVAGLNAAPKV